MNLITRLRIRIESELTYRSFVREIDQDLKDGKLTPAQHQTMKEGAKAVSSGRFSWIDRFI